MIAEVDWMNLNPSPERIGSMGGVGEGAHPMTSGKQLLGDVPARVTEGPGDYVEFGHAESDCGR